MEKKNLAKGEKNVYSEDKKKGIYSKGVIFQFIVGKGG